MATDVTGAGGRMRVVLGRVFARIGFREDSFLVGLAVLVGIFTAAAAVGFHTLIHFVRNQLYSGLAPRVDLYGRGIGFLIVIPAVGGLVVTVISRHVFRLREGNGIIDV